MGSGQEGHGWAVNGGKEEGALHNRMCCRESPWCHGEWFSSQAHRITVGLAMMSVALWLTMIPWDPKWIAMVRRYEVEGGSAILVTFQHFLIMDRQCLKNQNINNNNLMIYCMMWWLHTMAYFIYIYIKIHIFWFFILFKWMNPKIICSNLGLQEKLWLNGIKHICFVMCIF